MDMHHERGMEVTDSYQLDSYAADILCELGNIGAAHAATALSELLQAPIAMRVPQVELVPFDEISMTLGGPEVVVAGVFLQVTGDIEGTMFFIQSMKSAKQLVSNICGGEESKDGFSDIGLSALGEVGNILAANYLSALMDFTQLRMLPSVPLVAVDMAQSILSIALQTDQMGGRYALVIHTAVHHREEQEDAHFFLFPFPGAQDVLLHALGIGGSV
ncbi:CheY-P phosphatase CheC [Acidibacillus sp. S0AB]|uniref:CheY-P phosphatase CheC n=1 Tax=Sulfoacidibacillus ferrooxidans TaxID=2005001 RepID=A0A9X2ACB8_9BACL|nr:CheY-P phosphatase CheC [Sulfoacidibacillus ferrooxidans]